MKIKITCDSSADLTKELYLENNISVIPFKITMGHSDYVDGVDLDAKKIFDWVEKNKELPKTSAINEVEYDEFLKKHLKDHDALIHFSISSKISCTYENACRAAEKFKNVFVIDSLSLSSGVGLQVLYAAALNKQGLSPEEIVKRVNDRRGQVQISFLTYRLDYLHKGGRCSALQLLGSNILKIRPSIILKNGKMGIYKKYMGKHEKSLEKYFSDVFNEYNNPDKTLGFLTYSSATDELVKQSLNEIKKYATFNRFFETHAGATVTSHCGELTIGVIYYNDGTV